MNWRRVAVQRLAAVTVITFRITSGKSGAPPGTQVHGNFPALKTDLTVEFRKLLGEVH